MANFQFPGPLCITRQPWPLDKGTSMQTWSKIPGAVCEISSWYTESDNFIAALEVKSAPDLSFLFFSCSNPVLGISDQDYLDAARTLGAEVEAIKAVAEVETAGDAFDDDGHPRILFERHYFHRLTGGKYFAKHKSISQKTSGGYGKFSVQYTKLKEAYDLDATAALKSASWGKFQIMGENFKAAGFDTVTDFVFALPQSESAHLKAFANFVASNKKMLIALKTKSWASFAASYNGAGYKKNDYDTKMAAAYKRLKPPAAGSTPAEAAHAPGVKK